MLIKIIVAVLYKTLQTPSADVKLKPKLSYLVNAIHWALYVYTIWINLNRVYNSRSGCKNKKHFLCSGTKLPNLELKTWPNQLLGYLPC